MRYWCWGLVQAEERPERHECSKPLPVGRSCRHRSEFDRSKRDDSNGEYKQPGQPPESNLMVIHMLIPAQVSGRMSFLS